MRLNEEKLLFEFNSIEINRKNWFQTSAVVNPAVMCLDLSAEPLDYSSIEFWTFIMYSSLNTKLLIRRLYFENNGNIFKEKFIQILRFVHLIHNKASRMVYIFFV